MNHLNEEDLVSLYYAELYAEPTAPEGARTHLNECEQCRRAADALNKTLAICNEWTVPERSPEFGRDVWNRLAPELAASSPRRGWRRFFEPQPVRALVAAAGLAVLLVGVFFAGRFSRPTSSPAPVMAGLSDQARARILTIAVADHLDRVQMLLTEIANTQGSRSSNFATDRERAEDLVQEGRLMRQTLAAQGETATTGFLDEVERFLIEAAHTPDGAGAAQVRDLRERIDSGSLLFKVRIVESNLRNEEQKL